MNKTKQFLTAVMAVLLLSGCAQTGVPEDTGDTPVSETSDIADVSDTSAPAAETDAPAPFDPASDPYRGTVVNIDGDAIYYMNNHFNGDLSNIEDKCEQWFNRLYKDADVSDLLYNTNFVVPSETCMEYQDFYTRSLKTGEKLHETTEKLGKLYNTVYNEMQADPYKTWIGLCYENNINPWLSFRMNDVHFPVYGYGDDDFFIKAKQNGWTLGISNKRGSAYQWCLDYSVPEVQDFYSSYIDEMLGRYDVYGIELDWMRNIYCFRKDTEENCRYMDTFIKKINEIVAKYEKQYGHDIKIMLHLNRDIDQNKLFGFDLRTWAKNGWFDVAVPASVWGVTDSDMPIDVWKKELAQYGIEIYAGFEGIVTDSVYHTVPSLSAFTSMYLQRGADKIYLYNLFNSGAALYKPCASLQAALKAVKRSYVVTKQDAAPAVSGIVPFEPLPFAVNHSELSEPILLRHGRLSTRGDAYLYVGITNKTLANVEKAGLSVTYNGVECEYKGEAYRPFVGDSDAYRCIVSFKIPKEAWETAESGEIVFTSDSSVRIGYIELMNGMPTMG